MTLDFRETPSNKMYHHYHYFYFSSEKKNFLQSFNVSCLVPSCRIQTASSVVFKEKGSLKKFVFETLQSQMSSDGYGTPVNALIWVEDLKVSWQTANWILQLSVGKIFWVFHFNLCSIILKIISEIPEDCLVLPTSAAIAFCKRPGLCCATDQRHSKRKDFFYHCHQYIMIM